MTPADSALDTAAMGRARALLRKPASRVRAWPTLLAAVFCAMAAFGLAIAMILLPPRWEPVAPASPATAISALP